jgi:hypothetical protein
MIYHNNNNTDYNRVVNGGSITRMCLYLALLLVVIQHEVWDTRTIVPTINFVTAYTITPPLFVSYRHQQNKQLNKLLKESYTTVQSSRSSIGLYMNQPNIQQHDQQSSSSSFYGNVHGRNSCFLPLQQLEQDTYTPRIVYIAPGLYPHDITIESIEQTPSAEPSPSLGQFTYTFPFMASSGTNIDRTALEMTATIALEGSNIVASCVDPIVIIAEHESIGLVLPNAITDPVDLLVLVDRSKTYFSERKFLLFAVLNQVHIAAFNSREEIPDGATILGQVDQVTVPWLPAMAPTKTGFLEADEYY